VLRLFGRGNHGAGGVGLSFPLCLCHLTLPPAFARRPWRVSETALGCLDTDIWCPDSEVARRSICFLGGMYGGATNLSTYSISVTWYKLMDTLLQPLEFVNSR
jgi:hypothetical protein